MATFEIIEGKPGQGKSLYTARLCRKLIKRNHKWYQKSGIVRCVYSNIKFSKEFEDASNIDGQEFLKYWTSTFELTQLYNIDLLWDEIATELDSRNFSSLSDEIKRFLSQYRKRGVDIYANTQNFSMIDMRARLMVTRVASLSKILGSRDPSPTKPPVKHIWGLVMVRDVEDILSDDPHNKRYTLVPSFFFIDKEDVAIYDTTQDIPQSPPLPIRKVFTPIHFHGGDKDGSTEYRYF